MSNRDEILVELGKILAVFSEVYNEPLSDVTVEYYMSALEGYGVESLHRAFRYLRDTWEGARMPKPAHFIKAIRETFVPEPVKALPAPEVDDDYMREAASLALKIIRKEVPSDAESIKLAFYNLRKKHEKQEGR